MEQAPAGREEWSVIYDAQNYCVFFFYSYHLESIETIYVLKTRKPNNSGHIQNEQTYTTFLWHCVIKAVAK